MTQHVSSVDSAGSGNVATREALSLVGHQAEVANQALAPEDS